MDKKVLKDLVDDISCSVLKPWSFRHIPRFIDSSAEGPRLLSPGRKGGYQKKKKVEQVHDKSLLQLRYWKVLVVFQPQHHKHQRTPFQPYTSENSLSHHCGIELEKKGEQTYLSHFDHNDLSLGYLPKNYIYLDVIWVSNVFKPPNDGPIAGTSEPTSPKHNNDQQPALTLPPRQSNSRRTRFHTNSNAPQTHSIHSPKRTFKIPATSSTDNVSHFLDDKPLSPPKSLIESSHRRSISSTTCSIQDDRIFSPPRNLVESAHRRTISGSTCSFEKVLRKNNVDRDEVKEEDLKSQELNMFLKDERDKINNIFNGQLKGKAKIVLSGPSNS
ncbi:hypothetical protein RND71_017771 [Anisodus tanguticus]|uniref:Uncharacterized protein n=1 Tax=Anisodus tanguticus TaxID=243964 RepID=A0AAE1VJG6_9SOLA|nr:hypothetical protein RND71_017771 [Anisodus tanguticus]